MAKQICKDCGYIGKAKKKVKGSGGTEFSLWILALLLFFLFPPIGIIIGIVAVLYSLWRMFAPCEKICPKCSHTDTLIPLDSPVGKQMVEQFGNEKEEKKEPAEAKEEKTQSTIKNMSTMYWR